MTHIAFLSGYNDFEYAQQAIQYNIISYMLKPLTVSGLGDELRVIRKKIDAQFPMFRQASPDPHAQWSSFLTALVLDHYAEPYTADQGEEYARRCGFLRDTNGSPSCIVMVTILLNGTGSIDTPPSFAASVDLLAAKYLQGASFFAPEKVVSVLLDNGPDFAEYLYILTNEIPQMAGRVLGKRCCIGVSRLCKRAMEVLEQHYMAPDLSLVALRKMLSVSPNHLSACIKKYTRETFINTLIRKRMEAAQEMLSTTPLRIGEIAARCGYTDQHYFSYCFKKYCGESPNAMRRRLEEAKKVEAQHKDEISKLIAEAESYLKANYNSYFQAVEASCVQEKAQAQAKYQAAMEQLNKAHQETVSKLTDAQEIKDENYVHKNRLFDAKNQLAKDLQDVKDHQHAAFDHQYHLIDLLRMSRFTVGETMAQRWENYKYTFSRRDFLLRNGLYLAIAVILIAMCVLAPTVKNVNLLTVNNILNILQQASPRMFLALGVAGLILLAGTDLSIGRMVGMGITAGTIVMHKGINTGGVFGHIFDFTGLLVAARVFLALVVCIVLCTIFTIITGFFTAKFKMHPFISTMSTMLIIFGLATYATKGVSFGGIESSIPDMIIPKLGPDGGTKFPTIILWAVAAVIVVWFIWNKTTFGKNLYAVGGNPEAASVSSISVFKVTVGAFIMAGILYGFGSWLECIRMSGSGSVSYGQGWEMEAIAACVVGGVSFTGGIGKISGVVTGMFIFTALTYSLTTLG